MLSFLTRHKRFLLILLTSLFFTSHLSAKALPSDKTVVLIMFGDISFPIVVDKTESDTTPPPKPVPTITPPKSTYKDKIHMTIKGEPNSLVYINGRYSGTVKSNGTVLVTLDTSGTPGDKTYTTTLEDRAGNSSLPLIIKIKKINDPKFAKKYKGMLLYHHAMEPSQYRLPQLMDSDFNQLPMETKRMVADKLLSTLFFGYPLKTFEEKIQNDHFISEIRNDLNEDRTDKRWLEDYILDGQYFKQYAKYAVPETITILSRFYAMKKLDSYFLKNWIAYILTQTIMFSPANELDTTHTSDIFGVYNRIVNYLGKDGGMRYMTYLHMKSENNWRRFRSPEDNGREMLEIFLFDKNDTHVPVAAKALQNWKLDSDRDKLKIGSNKNTELLHLFGTTIVNGDDFYRELVKSDAFTNGVTKRLVDFFFTQNNDASKTQIVNAIVRSHPETWQDILLQIVFSKEYLLHTSRAKSLEETFFPLAKKLFYRHRKSTFHYMKKALENMHQAAMKYKLGRLKRVPLDSLSFAYYHKYIRENMMTRRFNPDKEYQYDAWGRQGWGKEFVTFDKFAYDENDPVASLDSLVNYIFRSTIARDATPDELAFFRSHMIYEKDGEKHFHAVYDMFATYDDPDKQAKQREEYKMHIANIVLDYISRLQETYTYRKVQ